MWKRSKGCGVVHKEVAMFDIIGQILGSWLVGAILISFIAVGISVVLALIFIEGYYIMYQEKIKKHF